MSTYGVTSSTPLILISALLPQTLRWEKLGIRHLLPVLNLDLKRRVFAMLNEGIRHMIHFGPPATLSATVLIHLAALISTRFTVFTAKAAK